MKYHKLGSLKKQKCIVSQFQRSDVQKSRCQQQHSTSETCKGESFLASSSLQRCRQPLAIPGSQTRLCLLVTWSSSCACASSLLLRTLEPILGLRPTYSRILAYVGYICKDSIFQMDRNVGRSSSPSAVSVCCVYCVCAVSVCCVL